MQEVHSNLLVPLLMSAVLIFVFFESAEAFNDEEPYYKWSPKYLYRMPSSHGIPQRSSRFNGNANQRYEGSLGSKSPGFLSFGSTLKRTEDYRRAGCMTDGQVCLFRSGLVGAVMKLPCCEGSTCTLLGAKFMCVDDSKLMKPNEEGLEPEVVKIDASDLAGWNQEIFGSKK